MKNIAFFLSVACAAAILYGNLPAQRISGCVKQRASEAVCVAAEWDNEKINLLPQYNPDNIKSVAVQREQALSQTGADNTVAIKA